MDCIPALPQVDYPPEPTQGILIDLLQHAECACSKNPALCMKHVLVSWFEQLYPEARKITRPGRFVATIRRIAAPTQPSLLGGSPKLVGDQLLHYRDKPWSPHHGEMRIKGELLIRIKNKHAFQYHNTFNQLYNQYCRILISRIRTFWDSTSYD